MRRGLSLVLLALAVAAPAAVLGSSRGPTSVGVSEREWRVSLYRTRVPTGVLRLNVHNYGEDGHDLAIRKRGGRVLATVSEVSPGASDTLRVRLRKPGRYVVFCSLEGHEAKGMRARLTVVKRRR
jgi:Cupredoxin-like domain